MNPRFQWFIWRVRAWTGATADGTWSLTRAVGWLVFRALALVALVQLIAIVAARWNDSMLELELSSDLAAHQRTNVMENALAADVFQALGIEPTRVEVTAICPAPGPAGPLEAIAPTCLLQGEVEFARDVLFLRHETHLTPSGKVFRDAVPPSEVR